MSPLSKCLTKKVSPFGVYVQLEPGCRTAATAGRLSAATMCRIQRLSAGKHSRSIQFPGTILSSDFHSPIFLGTSGFLQNFLELFLRSQSPNNRQKERAEVSQTPQAYNMIPLSGYRDIHLKVLVVKITLKIPPRVWVSAS